MAKFILSAPNVTVCPPDVNAEVAVLGRSNVGKSTLLGVILRHPSLVRTSRTPGRTQAMNYFSADDGRIFVDLPGYGYADVPPKVAREMLQMLNEYVAKRDALRGVLLLLDARRDKPSADDMQWLEHLQGVGRTVCVVVTKLDRIPKAKQKPLLSKLAKELEVDPQYLFGCSAETGLGIDAIRQAIDDLFGNA